MQGRKHSHSSTGVTASPTAGDDRTIAILGHELDNVLNGLLGMVRLLRESDLNPEQDRWSRAVEQSGRQLRRLVSAFRDDSGPGRPVAGKPVDGIDLLEQVVFSQSPQAEKKRNRLLLTVDPGLPRFWRIDPCRLRQLLDNLIGNANKFTTEGEILLSATRPAARVGANGLGLAVMDSGPGIDPRVESRIFEIGERGDGDTVRKHGGSGLGLYVCRQAAVSMGGDVRLRPSPWGGASFEVELPGVLPSEGEAEAPSSRILGCLECHLELEGPMRESVAGWLSRLGVAWHDAGVGNSGPQRRKLCLRVRESRSGGRPGPLLLEPWHGARLPDRGRRLDVPVMGSTLGPLLLEMALEWLWLRRDSKG